MFYYLFNKLGQLDCRMTVNPTIFPDGWFVIKGDDMGSSYLWSDGKSIYASDTPAPSEYHVINDNKWILPAYRMEYVLADEKRLKNNHLNEAAQVFVNVAAGLGNVPDFEFASWTIQAAESKAWAADQTAPTPVLEQIAASRGVPAETLKAAALKKTLAYEKLTAHIAGQRQALQSKIEAAKTQADLDKIVIKFTPPEAV